MPTPSPYLETLLNRWGARRQEVHKEVDALLDDLRIRRQSLDDYFARENNQQRELFATFERATQVQDQRWRERLRRLEEWLARVQELRTEEKGATALVDAIHWFSRVERVAARMARVAEKRLPALIEARQALHAGLETWLPELQAKEDELLKFKEKERDAPAPLLVSRSRKQPELEFAQVHSQRARDLGERLQSLRQTVNQFLGRLYKLSSELERRSQVNEGLFAVPRRLAEEELRNPQRSYFELREDILADALLFESGRRTLRWVKETAGSLKCVEDVYRQPESRLRRFVRRLTA